MTKIILKIVDRFNVYMYKRSGVKVAKATQKLIDAKRERREYREWVYPAR